MRRIIGKLKAQNKLFFTVDPAFKEALADADQQTDTDIMQAIIENIIAVCAATDNRHFRWFARLLSSRTDGIVTHKEFSCSSGKVEGTVKALEVYHTRDTVEKEFDDLKNERDMKRLRVHSSKAMDGRIFIQFMALILETIIRRALNEIHWFCDHDLRTALDDMKSIRQVRVPDRQPIVTTLTRRQQKLASAFGVDPATCV